eukprot:CAMPEP_0198585858 /NCGR_PEP_ID=MMETSP1462-20131121/129886_1 /TAXON_ID=1333877 /ORGANISM="Brandtodinium nutriculum, Strain RCC3387" /LENGTH=72 /DNA_ID=CAMNT_0044317301 /DNA_START=1 /DNA_END=219 /DNA_ORIENTATION=+
MHAAQIKQFPRPPWEKLKSPASKIKPAGPGASSCSASSTCIFCRKLLKSSVAATAAVTKLMAAQSQAMMAPR